MSARLDSRRQSGEKTKLFYKNQIAADKVVNSYSYDPYGIRTRVTAVKGRCLNRLTNGPYFIWRRRRDLNPRAACATYTLSRGASSATWVLPHMAPQVGLEPTTDRLTADSSTTELLRNNIITAWQRPTLTGTKSQLPSALRSLTSVFGMGTGVTFSPLLPDYLSDTILL